jgi:hypothetical protein
MGSRDPETAVALQGLQRLVSAGFAEVDASGTYQFGAAAAPVTAAPEPVVQRLGATSTVPVEAPAPEPVGSAEPSAKDLSSQYLRVLASRLYPHLSHELKTELRRDRERAGMITGFHR